MQAKSAGFVILAGPPATPARQGLGLELRINVFIQARFAPDPLVTELARGDESVCQEIISAPQRHVQVLREARRAVDDVVIIVFHNQPLVVAGTDCMTLVIVGHEIIFALVITSAFIPKRALK